MHPYYFTTAALLHHPSLKLGNFWFRVTLRPMPFVVLHYADATQKLMLYLNNGCLSETDNSQPDRQTDQPSFQFQQSKPSSSLLFGPPLASLFILPLLLPFLPGSTSTLHPLNIVIVQIAGWTLLILSLLLHIT